MLRTASVLILALGAAACAQTDGIDQEVSYGNDALPSAEVLAFQRADARLKWRDARIEWDANTCAVYQGRDASGAVRTEPLRNPDNSTICRP